jgi:hypothetical protein
VNRVTKGQLRSAFANFVRALGRNRSEATWYEHGSLYLSYEQYVGWKICEVSDDKINPRYPFGNVGRTASQLYDLIVFATRALSETAEYKEKEAKQIEEILALIGI